MKRIMYLFIVVFITGTAFAQTVEFRVNMSAEARKGAFTPGTDVVHLAGTFNGWNSTATELTGPDADTVYSVTIDTFNVGDNLEFKFVKNSDGWESISNRKFTVREGNTVFEAFFDTAVVSVEFKVNMSYEARQAKFTPGTDTVHIAGTFNGWNSTATELTGPDADTVYSVTIDNFKVGEMLEFKFVKNSSGWESISNRQFTVGSDNNVYEAVFDSVVAAAGAKNISVTFSCNMEFEIVSGRFKTATDTLTARGTFNGWSGNTYMLPSVSDPNYYEVTYDYLGNVGDSIEYKFAYISAGVVGWEGGDNRKYGITQDDYDNESAYIERTFDDLTLDNVTNNQVTIKFIVNMDSAKITQTGVPFSSIENVVITGAVAPLKWPSGGWPNADSTSVHYLYNDGTNGDEVAGDSLWTLDLTFPQYSALEIRYKYGANWAGDNGGSNDNEAASGSDHYFYLTPDILSGTVHNRFGVTGNHTLDDVVVVGVKEISNTIPQVYSLKQNYPNPFNPTTNIQFAIPKAGFVTMKVYNLLGQEVTTLVDEYKNAGTYKVDFNASNLSSGVYFYKIDAGNYTNVKKMILMK